MDPITIIFLILFLVLPAISRLLETRKQEGARQEERRQQGARPLPGPPHRGPQGPPHRTQQQQRQPGPRPEPEMEFPEMEDPLAEALRQIREALGQDEPKRPAPKPEPEPVPEAMPAYEAPPVPVYHRSERTPTAHIDLSQKQAPLKVERVSSGKNFRSRLARELRDPDAARHAVIMKEIFDPPLVIRRRARR
jgi:hypothetical protein